MSDLSHTDDQLTNETVELLQQLIRHECVNTGQSDSGEEIRNSDLLENFLEGPGVELEPVSYTHLTLPTTPYV